MFLHARLFPIKFSRAGLVVVSSISKIIRSFPSILFLTLLACKEICDTSVITVQLMVNFKGFSSHSTSQRFLANFLDPTLRWSGYNLALTRQILNVRPPLNETMGPGINKFFTSSFM